MRSAALLLLLAGCGGLSAFHTDARYVESDTDRPWWDTGDSGDTAATDDTDDTGDTSTPNDGPLLISEVVDHSELAYIKFVELYNPGSEPVSLRGWEIVTFSNGNTSGRTATLPSQVLPPGGLFVVANAGQGVAQFEDWYDRSADAYDGAINGNGNDTYELRRDGITIDIYGQVGVDGATASWNYTDAVARRARSVTRPSTVWQRGEWEITAGHLQSTPFLR